MQRPASAAEVALHPLHRRLERILKAAPCWDSLGCYLAKHLFKSQGKHVLSAELLGMPSYAAGCSLHCIQLSELALVLDS